MADEDYIPVVNTQDHQSDLERFIGKAKVDRENRKITIEFPEDGELARWFDLGRVRELYLSAYMDRVDVERAKEFREWQASLNAKE